MAQILTVYKDETYPKLFQAARLKHNLYAFGLLFNKRLICRHIFLALNLSMGVLYQDRITLLPTIKKPTFERSGKKLFVNSGFGIGYTL